MGADAETKMPASRGHFPKTNPKRPRPSATTAGLFEPLGFRFVLQHLATTVKAGGADVVTQVNFTGGGLHRGAWRGQGVVRTVHTALGRGLFVLLNGHGRLLDSGKKRHIGPKTQRRKNILRAGPVKSSLAQSLGL